MRIIFMGSDKRFEKTDFVSSEEAIAFAQRRELPDFSRQDIRIDQTWINIMLADAGVENGTVEFKNGMKRLLELRP